MPLDSLPQPLTVEELSSRPPQVGDPIQYGIEETYIDAVDGDTVIVDGERFSISDLTVTTSRMRGGTTWRVSKGPGQIQFPHWAR